MSISGASGLPYHTQIVTMLQGDAAPGPETWLDGTPFQRGPNLSRHGTAIRTLPPGHCPLAGIPGSLTYATDAVRVRPSHGAETPAQRRRCPLVGSGGLRAWASLRAPGAGGGRSASSNSLRLAWPEALHPVLEGFPRPRTDMPESSLYRPRVQRGVRLVGSSGSRPPQSTPRARRRPRPTAYRRQRR